VDACFAFICFSVYLEKDAEGEEEEEERTHFEMVRSLNLIRFDVTHRFSISFYNFKCLKALFLWELKSPGIHNVDFSVDVCFAFFSSFSIYVRSSSRYLANFSFFPLSVFRLG
jgi:hypothetical protein